MAATVQRRRLSLGVLLLMTALGVALCVLMLGPFVPGLAWALALAVTALPMHRRVQRVIRIPNLAAGLSVCLVTLMLLTPAVFIGWEIGKQASEGLSRVQRYVESGEWRQTLRQYPVLRSVLQAVNAGQTPEQATREIVPEVQRQAGAQLKFVPGIAIQVALALFTLFFLLRDRLAILNATRSLLPMTDDEATYFFHRIAGMTHATIYGTVVVALIQGGLGGLIFYLVGIPNALLWGVAMSLLALIPTAGAFLIWIPAAIVLAAQGHWTKAGIVGAWGAVVVASVDNILFPTLVGKEMRLHTLPVFLAILGGLSLFGAAGLVLGPVILAATVTLVEIIKRRIA
jgi:predicted PurR-regulated permease PerM